MRKSSTSSAVCIHDSADDTAPTFTAVVRCGRYLNAKHVVRAARSNGEIWFRRELSVILACLAGPCCGSYVDRSRTFRMKSLITAVQACRLSVCLAAWARMSLKF